MMSAQDPTHLRNDELINLVGVCDGCEVREDAVFKLLDANQDSSLTKGCVASGPHSIYLPWLINVQLSTSTTSDSES
jgi:hypothetical protein